MAVNSTLTNFHTSALDAALRVAAPGKIDGISTYGPSRPISLWWQGQTAVLSPADEVAVQAVFDAHDPVFIMVNKTAINADGVDAVTVTVTAPKPGAAAVVLSVSLNDGAPSDWPIALVAGVGTDTLTSLDPATFTITVKNPANRSADQLTINAR